MSGGGEVCKINTATGEPVNTEIYNMWCDDNGYQSSG